MPTMDQPQEPTMPTMPPKDDDAPTPKPLAKPAAPLQTRPLANPENAASVFRPIAPAPTTRTLGSGDAYLENCPKGTLVRLLMPIFDGVQRIPEDTEIYWPHAEPPLKTVAVHAGTKDTPLDAPAMTDGKPGRDYVDPTTGEKPIIESH